MKKDTSNFVQALYISSIIILIATFSFILLEKTQVIDFYSKPESQSSETTSRPVNDVDYSPASPTDNNKINEEKESGDIITKNDPSNTDESQPINVVLTAATQDEPGGPVVVRVLLNDTRSGECNIVLSKGGLQKKYTKNVVNAGTYYNCEALDIPSSELDEGTWLLSVNVISGNRTGSAEQSVEVRL